MALKKITGKDIKEAVDWLWEHKQDGGCVHQVLETTNDGTKLCFVVGWSKGVDYGGDEKEYGYFDDGYCISAKIGYQHRNNAMQTDYDWDFNMPYDLETGDVWDTSSYVPRDADWEREAADYNKEAEKIWAAYGDPDGKNWWDDDADEKAPLDLMESKKKEAKKHTCSMQKKKESLNTRAESEDATSFEVKDDGIYVNGECITLNADDWYADKRETKTLSDVIPEMVGSRKVFVIDPQYDYYIVKTLYTGKDIKPVKKVKVYKDFELYDTADVVSACVGDYVRDIGPIVSESKKHTCSMQKKKESLARFVVSNAETAVDTLCEEILSHTNDDFVINDADAAEIVGKYAIMRELDGFGGYSGTADEFAEWVDTTLSGSPLDGSPFGSAEATEYARKVWTEEE